MYNINCKFPLNIGSEHVCIIHVGISPLDNDLPAYLHLGHINREAFTLKSLSL